MLLLLVSVSMTVLQPSLMFVTPVPSRPARTRKGYESSDTSTSSEAQKKFGNAKGISSDQFFNKNEMDVSADRANIAWLW